MRMYIYVLRLNSRFQDPEAWTDHERNLQSQHANRLERQLKRGKVKFAGRTDLPIGNAENFGMVVFEAANDEVAELFAQSDPAVAGNLMTATCLPYHDLCPE